jgi:hypothetical protein
MSWGRRLLIAEAVCAIHVHQNSSKCCNLSFEYWNLNPDQATDNPEKSPPDPICRAKMLLNKKPNDADSGSTNGTKNERDSPV